MVSLPQLNGDDLSLRFYKALNPIADRMRHGDNTQGDKKVLADDLPQGIACARATKKLRTASKNKPQITLITIA